MLKMAILTTAMFITFHAWAAAPLEEGKALLQSNCLGCHDANIDPPMGPPMFGIQKTYMRATTNREAFIETLTAFTVHPNEEKALMKDGVELLGLMPDIGMEEADARKIAAYIHDTTFAPPCSHWQASMKAARERGDMQHLKKDEMMYNRLCINKTEDRP